MTRSAVGRRYARQVTVGIGPGGRGRLVVDVDVTQLLGKPSDLGFGRTGVKFLVTPSGTIVAGSTAVGTTLLSGDQPRDRGRGRAGDRGSSTARSSGGRWPSPTSRSPGRGLGILVQQARSEVMGGADALAALLRWAAVLVGLLGATLAVVLRRLPPPARPAPGRQRTPARRQRSGVPPAPRAVPGRDADRGLRRQSRRSTPVRQPGGDAAARPGESCPGRRRRAGRDLQRLRRRHRRALPGDEDPAAPCPAGRDDARRRHGDPPAGTTPSRSRCGAHPCWATTARWSSASPPSPTSPSAAGPPSELQFLSAITANMSEGVVLVRADDSTIAYANGSYESMFGYEPDELVGRIASGT